MSRPKRVSAQRAAAFILQSQTSALFWNEERDLKKALHASLVEARRKARIAEKEAAVANTANAASAKTGVESGTKCKSKTKTAKEKSPKESPMNSLSNFALQSNTKVKVIKSEETETETEIDNCLKKPRIPAQRKFAQGSSNNTPVSTPIKVGYCVPTTVAQEVFTKHRPTAEDFLTFLCFRNSRFLPPSLNLEALNKPTEVSKSENEEKDIEVENKVKINDISITESASKKLKFEKVACEKTINSKIEALKTKYKLQRLAKQSNTAKKCEKLNTVPLQSKVPSKSKTKPLSSKTPDNQIVINRKDSASSSKSRPDEEIKNVSPNLTQRVLRSHQNPTNNSAELSPRSSFPSLNCLCKSQAPSRSSTRQIKKSKRPYSPQINTRPAERKAKPIALLDYHLETEEESESEHFTSKKDNILKKDDVATSTKTLSSLTSKSRRVLRSRQSLTVQSNSHMKSPSKVVNKCQTQTHPSSSKKVKASSSPEVRPSRKAKPNAPLIDYHFEIEGESDVETKLRIKEEKQKLEMKSSIKKFETLKNPSIILTRTQIPQSQQQLYVKPSNVKSNEQKLTKVTLDKNKLKAKFQPEKRVTRSLSIASKKEEEAAKEREKEIQRKILEVEKRQKLKMSRHASESSLHSSSSSDSSSSSASSSSSINIPRITRSLEQLKKLQKEFKKNKQKLLNGTLTDNKNSNCKDKAASKCKKSIRRKAADIRAEKLKTPPNKLKVSKTKVDQKQKTINLKMKAKTKKKSQESSTDEITRTLQTMAEGLNSSDDHCVPDIVYCDSAPIQGLITREFSGAFAEETVTTASAMLLPSSSTSTSISSFAQTCSHFYAQTHELSNHKATVDASTNTTEEEILALSVDVGDIERNTQSHTVEQSVGTQTVTPVGSPISEAVEEIKTIEPLANVDRKTSSRCKSAKAGSKV